MMNTFRNFKEWYSAQTPTAKGLMILGILLIIGIIIRWDFISQRVLESFGIFRQ